MKAIRIFFILFLLQLQALFLYGQFSERWGDQKNGTYVNPVLPADYSDLDAIRVGADYYAISSTMQFSPGMVVLHSRDLVNWEIIGHVVKDLTTISPELNWNRMNAYGKGIWAGSIRYYKNRFWVYFGTPDDGFFMSSASSAAGPWEPLHQVWKITGWDDCSSFCDDDGQLYFIATNFEFDRKTNKQYNIHLFRMRPDGKNLITSSDTIIHQSKGSEANKLYKIGGVYFHYFSEVKEEGRVMMIERAKKLTGPWEIRQLNHVNAKLDKEPNQGGLIQLPNRKWYFFTHHGTGDWEGRAASLLPVQWVDGWPIVGAVGEDGIGRMVWSATKPINSKKHLGIKGSDDFSSPSLGGQWEWNYQPRSEKWSLTQRPGHLRLHAFKPINSSGTRGSILMAGNTLTQRSMRTRANTVTIKINIDHMADGEYAGLTHFSTASYTTLGVRQSGNERHLVYEYNGKDTVGARITANTIWLRSTWDIHGKNTYSFSMTGRAFVPFAGVTQLTWGSYRGDRIGIYNYNVLGDKGFVDIDWFRYRY
ncbi:glycoside hydrolase 43 family protein [Mucilaginibacter sabulilitoris]|uniref:Glycoside hydrolase 43 family protein n=1 Tax=Mucilaginibacter sabulilitoris TaxID=1173583 RepID=A0ABZ0TFF4_9SPHI|nr:glycoside hydrolase 43 family protein [Mucilaginibacter sabulilitoris]WPU90938.1 glycoside hydrolase 43 family protein [Mucilaginibacter sabulilitoris]